MGKAGNKPGRAEVTAARDSLAYRKKNFRVKIEDANDDLWTPGAIHILVTKNGFQWEGLALLPDELEAVINALQMEKGKQEYKKRKPAKEFNRG